MTALQEWRGHVPRAEPVAGPGRTWSTYVGFARRHAKTLLVCTVVGFLAGIGWAVLRPTTYSATAEVALSPVPSYVSVRPSGRLPRLVTIDTDAHLVRDPRVLEAVARTTGQDPTTVTENLQVTAVPLTRVLRITFTAGSPSHAVEGASTAAETMVWVRERSLLALQDDQVQQLRFTISQLEKRLYALRPGRGTEATASALAEQIGELDLRLVVLDSARTNAAEVTSRPALPRRGDHDIEVPLTSGLMLGLLAGCATGVVRDVRASDRHHSLAVASGVTGRGRGV